MKKWICVLLSMLLLFTTAMSVSAVPEEEMVDRDIVMEAEKQADGSILVWLTDDTGSAVPSWIVYLDVDGVTVKTIDVDSRGAALIDYEFPTERASVTCRSYTGPYDTVNYIGSTIDLTTLVYDGTTPSTEPTEATQATEATEATTTPTESEEGTTTAPSTETTVPPTTPDQGALSLAPFTTSVNDEGRIAVGVDVDNGVINASQLTAEAFVIESRMWMDSAQYAQLVSTTDATLHLELTLHAEAGSKSNLIAAKNKNEAFASYADSEVTGFAFNTSLVYVDGELRAPLDVGDGRYVIEMPLPACFDQCEKLAVAVCTVDGLGPFVEVPKADKLNIEIERFQTIALVGFGKSAVAGGSWLDWLLWGGIALVVIGVALLVFFTFRRKKGTAPTETEAIDEREQGGSPRHILIKPVADEEIESEAVLSPEEIAQKVLMDFDEQTELTSSEREQFRAKEPAENSEFDQVAQKAVTAAGQIADHQMETIRRSVEQAKPTEVPPNTERVSTAPASITVDDLLDELDDLIDQ
ncbi:MAG: hypothetical protein IJD01_03415 [Clostridia bacterium]|nr:hypothetical protein [Clostridia bacterium]